MRSLFGASSWCLALDQLGLYRASFSYEHRNPVRTGMKPPLIQHFDEKKADLRVFTASRHFAALTKVFLVIPTSLNYANNMPL